ncbi:dirigent protein 22-like [Lathyrus oleraceus]|uniref:dirigent protein 22-like n=1 Tax=Pisum sativum TaxID=3888 RepID=UPI0021CFBC62|nr:dirigent protein 22-like [Pisum sativum]
MAMGAFQKIFLFLLIISCYILIIVSEQEETGFVSSINPKFFKKKETFSHFRFYWQDIVGGNNATSIPIIPSIPKFDNSFSAFGLVRIIDNALTLGPKLNSKLLGRAQGFYAATSQTELVFLMVMNFALFEGKYNGSVITISGRDVAYDKIREMSVIGGSGVFRFAKGYVEANTISFDPITGDTIVEYNVFVSH